MSHAQPLEFGNRIEAAMKEFDAAGKAKSPSRLAALFAEDGTLLPPGMPLIKGRSNIEAFWDGFIKAGASDPKHQSIRVESSGDIAYEIGTWQANIPNPQTGKVGPANGTHLTVWKRQPDGDIKMVADMFTPIG